MNSLFVVALLFGLAVAEDDGQWKGEGLAESQDFGQYNGIYPAFAPYAYTPLAYARAWNYGAAPLAADGRVLDTPEVASAKAAFFAAYNAAAAGAGAPAPYAYYGYGAPVALTADGKFLQDTPEVAQAKAAHFAAKAAALNHVW